MKTKRPNQSVKNYAILQFLTKQPGLICVNACVHAGKKRARAWTVAAQTFFYKKINYIFRYQLSNFNTWNIILKMLFFWGGGGMNLKCERDEKQEKTNDSDSLPALVL